MYLSSVFWGQRTVAHSEIDVITNSIQEGFGPYSEAVAENKTLKYASFSYVIWDACNYLENYNLNILYVILNYAYTVCL